jgi:hypothetical protein
MRLASRPSAVVAIAGLLLSCTGGGSTAPSVAASLISPAPRAAMRCMEGPVLTTSLETANLPSALAGHVPPRLPEGFGLEGLWGDGTGSYARWGDARCRTIGIETWTNPTPIPSPWPSGPKAGAFTLVGHEPPTCVTPGPKPCFAFRAQMPPGLVEVDVVGLPQREAFALVRGTR